MRNEKLRARHKRSDILVIGLIWLLSAAMLGTFYVYTTDIKDQETKATRETVTAQVATVTALYYQLHALETMDSAVQTISAGVQTLEAENRQLREIINEQSTIISQFQQTPAAPLEPADTP